MPAEEQPGITSESKELNFLLVEDNLTDVHLFEFAMNHRPRKPFRLNVVNDGMSAERFMRRQEPYVDAPVCDLVLLDLNLPKLDGLELLRRIRSSIPEYGKKPVVVLSCSKDKSSINKAYEEGANGYFVKPMKVGDTIAMVDSIVSHWLNSAENPKSE
jgi:CheY-like chemotaxis protein